MNDNPQRGIDSMAKGGIRLLLILILGTLFIFPAQVLGAPKTIQACGMAPVMDGNLGRAKT